MTTSVAFPCFGALVAFLMLACAGVAAMPGGSFAGSNAFIKTTLTQSSDCELLQTTNTSGICGESLLFNVTINDNDAILLRQEMEAINDRLANKTRKLSFPCGNVNLTANVTKINLDPQDIPSYFYNVQCPTNCSENNEGAKSFNGVVAETVVYMKLDNGTYEAWRRSQNVSCIWVESNNPVHQSPHPTTAIPNNDNRR